MFLLTPTSVTSIKVILSFLKHILNICILGSIVPSFLHRVQRRCTDQRDKKHHASFLLRILEHRNQNMKVIKHKFDNFMVKLRKVSSSARLPRGRHPHSLVNLKFDGASKFHALTRSCILRSYKNINKPMPRLVYSSLPKIMSSLVTKRSLLRKIKAYKSSI